MVIAGRAVLLTREQADDIMQRAWVRLQDSCTEFDQGMAAGTLALLGGLELLNELEVEAWTERLKRCPEGGVHLGGRSFCAFCWMEPSASLVRARGGCGT